MMVHHNQCPACESQNLHFFSTIKDHSVSGEDFPVWECSNCSLRFTQDIPEQDKIGKYYQSESYVSHTDSTKGIINQLYHQIRKLTIKQKCKLVAAKTGLTKGKMLDIGCGTGAFLHAMNESGWEVVGLEPDDTAASIAREKYKLNPQSPDNLFRLESNSFNAITMWHVLEHVHTLDAYVAQLHQLLTNDGVLFIAVPNYTSADATHYGTAWAAYDVPRHLYHFSPTSMKALLNRHGFELVETKPMWFDALYVSMLSEKYYTGKSSLAKAVFQGIRSNIKALSAKDTCSSLIYVIKKKK